MTAASSVPAARLAPATATSRRRAGRGLLAFGLSGVALLALAAWLVLGSLGALGTAAADLEAQRVRLVGMLPAAEAALEGAATSASNASTSLDASGVAARDGAALVTELATAMDGMARAAQISVLGVQPFAALADDLTSVAERSRTLASDLTATADALDRNVDDTEAAAADLRTLAADLAALRIELETDEPATEAAAASAEASIALARLVLLGLLAWLAVPAIVALWLGWRWARA